MSNIKNTIDNYLKISVNDTYDNAMLLCNDGIVGDECSWYHSVWQYLRLLDVVSSPTWHDSFYTNELSKKITSNCNILVCGTADYSMLAYVIEIAKAKGVTDANIYVLDTCKTPLNCCKWYSEKRIYNIKIVNEDILKYKNDNFFDVICTDAFLTRFNKQTVPIVIDKWKQLLKHDGRIITTIRIHDENDLASNELDSAIEKFKLKVIDKAKEYQEYIRFSPNELGYFAETYAKKMKSSNLGSETDIIKLFDEFNINFYITLIPVELKETKYIEIIAEKQ